MSAVRPVGLPDLIRDLTGCHEVGGYTSFVVVDDKDRRYEIVDVECHGNGIPLIIRIGDPQ